nr:12474_t:CDS:2 [Entrophospora candida]
MLVDREQDNVRQRENIYDQVPFTTAAEELLRAIKENLVEELIEADNLFHLRSEISSLRDEQFFHSDVKRELEAKLKVEVNNIIRNMKINSLYELIKEKSIEKEGLTFKDFFEIYIEKAIVKDLDSGSIVQKTNIDEELDKELENDNERIWEKTRGGISRFGKSDPQAIAELQGSSEIKFYENGKPYYEFTNFYQGTPIKRAIPTLKYSESDKINLAKEIWKKNTGRDAQKFTRGKTARNLRKMLLDTGEAKLIEDSGQLPLDEQRNLTGMLEKDSETRRKYIEIRTDTNFYEKVPYLSISEELVQSLKEGLISELIIVSGFISRGKEGDPRKTISFANTFGKFPNTI